MKRKLGSSDVSVTPITMGAWAIGGFMWGGNEEKDSIAAIQAYIDNGVTSIDTAPIYGFGYSEELVGKAIRNYDRSKIEILTKFGMVWDIEKGDFAFEGKNNQGALKKIYRYGGYDRAISDVELNLKRLQTDYIDLIQLHWPDTTTPIDETMRAMEKLLQDGKVRAVGVCNYSAAQLEEAEKTVKLASNQVPYSMLKRDIETEVVPYALKNNLSVIAYSPMERGLLTGKYENMSALSAEDHRNNYFKKFDFAAVKILTDHLADLSTKYNATIAQLVLAWTYHQPSVATAVAGARNARQAEENSRALHIKISAEDLSLIDGWLDNKFLI
jgi:aryl-alcohol dehydrogenase-like predicted oxidoreductase